MEESNFPKIVSDVTFIISIKMRWACEKTCHRKKIPFSKKKHFLRKNYPKLKILLNHKFLQDVPIQ